MQSIYGFLADLIVVIHFLYVAYVVVGQLAIFVGVLLKWQWIRNPWFRWTHLVMICIVAVESIFDFRCPLTDWQVDLEKLAGRQGSDRPFVAQLFENILFCDVNVDHWAFKVGYISFAVLVIACLLLAPPRKFRSQGTGIKCQETGIRSQETGIKSQETRIRNQTSDP